MADASTHGLAPGPTIAGVLVDIGSASPAAAAASPALGAGLPPASTDTPSPAPRPPPHATSPSEASCGTGPQQRPGPPQSASSPASTAPAGTSAEPGSSAMPLELFPADITAVHTAQELVDAMAGRARDIEIRAHLDLRTMPLQAGAAPINVFSNADDQIVHRPTDLAFIRWPTRTMRVRFCGSSR